MVGLLPKTGGEVHLQAASEQAVCSMTARAKAILEAKGGDISMG